MSATFCSKCAEIHITGIEPFPGYGANTGLDAWYDDSDGPLTFRVYDDVEDKFAETCVAGEDLLMLHYLIGLALRKQFGEPEVAR